MHLPPATEQQVRSHGAQLVDLAARHGITDLAFASPGRLRGHVADHRDLFDTVESSAPPPASSAPRSPCTPTGRCANNHVSADLAAATPL
jgi:hypothetical protein